MSAAIVADMLGQKSVRNQKGKVIVNAQIDVTEIDLHNPPRDLSRQDWVLAYRAARSIGNIRLADEPDPYQQRAELVDTLAENATADGKVYLRVLHKVGSMIVDEIHRIPALVPAFLYVYTAARKDAVENECEASELHVISELDAYRIRREHEKNENAHPVPLH